MMRGGGGGRGGGWGSVINAPEERPEITRSLIVRVIQYAKPYRWQIITMLVIILLSTGLSLLTPLVMRDLIDNTIPSGNVQRLIWLAIAMLAIPIFTQFTQCDQPSLQFSGRRRCNLRLTDRFVLSPAANVTSIFHQQPGG